MAVLSHGVMFGRDFALLRHLVTYPHVKPPVSCYIGMMRPKIGDWRDVNYIHTKSAGCVLFGTCSA